MLILGLGSGRLPIVENNVCAGGSGPYEKGHQLKIGDWKYLIQRVASL